MKEGGITNSLAVGSSLKFFIFLEEGKSRESKGVDYIGERKYGPNLLTFLFPSLVHLLGV